MNKKTAFKVLLTGLAALVILVFDPFSTAGQVIRILDPPDLYISSFDYNPVGDTLDLEGGGSGGIYADTSVVCPANPPGPPNPEIAGPLASPTWSIDSGVLSGTYTLNQVPPPGHGRPCNQAFPPPQANNYSFDFTVDVSPLPPGTHTITICADSFDGPLCGSISFGGGGAIQVNSKNSQTGSGVSSEWDFTSYPSANDDPCDEGCSGISKLYDNQSAGLYTLDVIDGSAGSLHAFREVQTESAKTAVEAREDRSIFGTAWHWLVGVAKAVIVSDENCDPPNTAYPCQDVPVQNLEADEKVNFVIAWDPIATLDVSINTLNISAPQFGSNPTVTMQAVNNGAEGSTLQWIGTPGGANGNKVKLDEGSGGRPQDFGDSETGSVTVPTGSTTASQNVSVTADITGLAPGTYNNWATITYTGVSQPIDQPTSDIETVNINLTITNPTACPNRNLTNEFEACVYTYTGNPPASPVTGTTFNSTFTESQVNHDYVNGGPNGLRDRYAIRWQGRFDFEAGTYRFRVERNDGARLHIDGTTRINEWSNVVIPPVGRPQLSRVHETDMTFAAAAQRDLVLDYYEFTGRAIIRLSWVRLPNPPSFDNVPPPSPNPDTTTCERITIAWNDNSDNESGFYVWRNPAASGPTKVHNGITYRRIATAGANTTSFTDTPPQTEQSYSYLVTAFNAAGESAVHASWPVGPVLNVECTPDISASTKQIIQVNGVAYNPSTTIIRNGNTVRFRISIRNTGNSEALDIYIVDTLTDNLRYVNNSARLNGAPIPPPAERVSGQTITWPQRPPPGRNLGDLDEGGTWTLEFNAVVNSPSNQVIDFIQNVGIINFIDDDGEAQSVTVKTPLTPIRTDRIRTPDIREVAP